MSSCITKTDVKTTTTQINLQIEEFFNAGGKIYHAKHGESCHEASLSKREKTDMCGNRMRWKARKHD